MSFKAIFCALGILVALSTSASGHSADDRWTTFDEPTAKAEARRLMPVIADRVTGGRRGFLQALPTGEYTGHLYQFELRPEPTEYTDYCERQTLSIRHDFVQESDLLPFEAKDYDLSDHERIGNLKPADVYVQSYFLKLSPEPTSEEEQRAKCRSIAREAAWISATHVSAVRDEHLFLDHLRNELRKPSNNIVLKCVRDEDRSCRATKAMIIEALSLKRRGFESIYLATGIRLLSFEFGEPRRMGEANKTTSVIVEKSQDEITSITLVERTAVAPVV